MFFIKVLPYLVGMLAFSSATVPSTPIVRPNIATFNTNGSITGTIMPGYRTPYIEAFLGIPFAEPPLGNLRFSNPVPFPNFWSHDHIANEEREMCIQQNILAESGDSPIEGSEDCLYLNIYRPLGTSSANLLPVIIMIHGGAFISGTPSPLLYGPKYFMDHGDVIFVTSAYRLGPLGFLSTGDSELPGNFGLKDQALAMAWIKENILFLNGDPTQITIIGQSAGGASVHLHMFSPLSRDLFDRVGAMSGSGIAPFAVINEDPIQLARLLAKGIGIQNYDTLTTAELATEFKATEPRAILEAVQIFHLWLSEPTVIFRPVVENENPNAFLIEDPRISIANGNYKTVPLFITIVPEEGVVRSGSLLTSPAQLESFNENFDLALGVLTSIPQDDPEYQDKIDQIGDFYFNGTRNIGWHNSQQVTDMLSDRMFHYPFYSTYKFHSKSSDPLLNPLYLMEFNYRGPFSFSYIFAQSTINFGVIHGDDLLYLVDNGYFPQFDLNSIEAEIITEMVNIYVNFATGRLPHEKSTICTFDAADPDRPCEYLYIENSVDGYEVTTSTDTDFDMINFWRSIDKLF